MTTTFDAREIEDFLRRIVGGAQLNALRDEDAKKVRELRGLLPEIERAIARAAHPSIVDAASGRGWVGLAALAMIGPRLDRPLSVTAIERDPRRVELAIDAAAREGLDGFHGRVGDLAELALWPERPDLVVALHACGDATDRTIESALAMQARNVLVVPCCVRKDLPAAARAREALTRLGIPSRGEIRRRFVEAYVMGARTLALEAGGYQTDVVSFVGESVTPHNVALRGRFVNEPVRRKRAQEDLARLLTPG